MTDKKDKNNEIEIKVKNKLRFSERLVLGILISSWVTVLSAIIYTFKYQSEMVWSSILDTIRWLSTGTVGFFVWKAKSENMVRIKNNPNFNLKDYIQQMWNKFEEEGNRLDDSNYY